jgi:hypothetical protein
VSKTHVKHNKILGILWNTQRICNSQIKNYIGVVKINPEDYKTLDDDIINILLENKNTSTTRNKQKLYHNRK